MNKPELHISRAAPFKARYGNFIGGAFVEPSAAAISIIFRRSPAERSAKSRARRRKTWSLRSTPPMRRARPGQDQPALRGNLLNAIAQKMQDNLDLLALAEHGTMAADPRDDARRRAACD